MSLNTVQVYVFQATGFPHFTELNHIARILREPHLLSATFRQQRNKKTGIAAGYD